MFSCSNHENLSAAESILVGSALFGLRIILAVVLERIGVALSSVACVAGCGAELLHFIPRRRALPALRVPFACILSPFYALWYLLRYAFGRCRRTVDCHQSDRSLRDTVADWRKEATLGDRRKGRGRGGFSAGSRGRKMDTRERCSHRWCLGVDKSIGCVVWQKKITGRSRLVVEEYWISCLVGGFVWGLIQPAVQFGTHDFYLAKASGQFFFFQFIWKLKDIFVSTEILEGVYNNVLKRC